MTRVIYNKKVDENYYLLKVEESKKVSPGQFFMLRAWENYPTLSRPISIFNEDRGLEFLYQVVGRGTEILRSLKAGDDIKIFGPYGRGFDLPDSDLAMVGGGVGVAPFYYLTRKIKEKNPKSKITFYIGEDENLCLENLFKNLDIDLRVKKGGFITDLIDFKNHKLIYTCGPNIMMEKVYEYGKNYGSEIFVSLDLRMGCGLGACLSCSVDTKNGRKRSCKEGPVFRGGDIYE